MNPFCVDPEEDDCRDLDEGSCGAFGQRLFAFGSEDCEFCPRGAECRGGTLRHESMRGGSSS